MLEQIIKLKDRIAPLRDKIFHHKVYSEIKNLDHLKIFMQHHIYAVWDFMSLLKSLQINLTCTSIPWFPTGSPDTRYLINEIVTGEESDIDMFGNRTSHFELYLQAMNQCGADTSAINSFILSLKQSKNIDQSLKISNTPIAAQNFINFTFDIINSKKSYLQAAIFTFGREDLIPRMFISLVNDIHKNFPNIISIFKYYLERHIEIDGEHHSNLAMQMIENLCGSNDNYWNEAEQYSILALEKRIALWDGAFEQIMVYNKSLKLKTIY